MWAWMKRWFSTDTRLLQAERKHNRELQMLLAASLKDSQALNAKFIESLDRVILSRFDAPVMAKPMQQPNVIAFPDLTDVLSLEDDTEFLEKTSV